MFADFYLKNPNNRVQCLHGKDWENLVWDGEKFNSTFFHFLCVCVCVSVVFFFFFPSTYTKHPEKAMAPHSSILAWKIPWTEDPGRLRSMGSLRVGQD